jgi:hypothetical protein
LILGVTLIVLGIAAVFYSFAAGIATALFFGFFLVVGGLFHIAGSFFTRGWGGFFLSLLAGVLELPPQVRPPARRSPYQRAVCTAGHIVGCCDSGVLVAPELPGVES